MVLSMTTDVRRRAGMISVGPPDGPQVKVPAAYTITVTGDPPYDLRLGVTWDANLGRHTLHELTITEQPDGVYVRMSQISQIALAEIIERCLVGDVLGGPDGWQQLVADHADDDPVAVDALVYLLSPPSVGRDPRQRSPSPVGSRRPAGRSGPPTPARPDCCRRQPSPARRPDSDRRRPPDEAAP